MKAAVVESPNNIQYCDIQEPELKPGTVKVAVKYCGICGSDIPRVLDGACHSFPQILGHEFSGIIHEVADDVHSVDVGDTVVGVPLVPCFECSDCKKGNYSLCKHYSFIGSRQQGAMAEFVVIPEKNVYKVDSSIELKYAALFEPSTIALHGIQLTHFDPKDNDRVLVIGAGTIALFTIQWCRLLGAKNITVIGRNKTRLSIAKKYGATTVLSSLDDDYQTIAMGLTDGQGFDYIFDAAGTSSTIKDSLRLAANKSIICFIGTPNTPVSFSIKEWELINRKEIMITGSWMSYSAPWPGKEWTMTAEKLASGQLIIGDDMIYSFYPLSEVKEAFRQYEINRSSIKGRVMLII